MRKLHLVHTKLHFMSQYSKQLIALITSFNFLALVSSLMRLDIGPCLY